MEAKLPTTTTTTSALVHVATIHVYTISLKRAIPKAIQIGGRRVRTKYTGQDCHLQIEKEEKEELSSKEKCIRQFNNGDGRQETDIEVTQPEQDNTSVNQGATAPAEAVEEEMTATAQEEEAPKLSVEGFCDAMETSAIFGHGEEAPFENAGKKRKKKGTKEKDSGDEGQVKRSLAQRYKIGIDILEMTVTYDMVHRLPAEAFDESDHTLGMLYGLFYFMKDGCLHNQEWFVEGAPPPPSPRISGTRTDMRRGRY